jgi:hypothetical protein
MEKELSGPAGIVGVRSDPRAAHPVQVAVDPALTNRNRLTCAFRPILVIPHILLVGGPIAFAVSFVWHPEGQPRFEWGAGAGVLGGVAAVAYLTLLRDEYPPFGEGPYGAVLTLSPPDTTRDRVTVAFRIFLALPHIFVLWLLGIAWAVTTVIAWACILFTGKYPPGLYHFAVGVLRWSTRVEAYLLLLHDAYPPFSLE